MKLAKFVVALTSALSLVAAKRPKTAAITLQPEDVEEFVESNNLAMIHYTISGCKHCPMVSAQIDKAANELNKTDLDIKLAKVDCSQRRSVCKDLGIVDYPSLQLYQDQRRAAYKGRLHAEGFKETLLRAKRFPIVSVFESNEFEAVVSRFTRPFFVQINGDKVKDEAYEEIAEANALQFDFVLVDNPALNEEVSETFGNIQLGDDPTWMVVHPNEFDRVSIYPKKFINKAEFVDFFNLANTPNFGEVTRQTYPLYTSPHIPLAYFFYNDLAQVNAYREKFEALGEHYQGRVNFVSIDATVFGGHAELLDMDPAVVPMFVIHDSATRKKYGVDQKANPDGPSFETITQFVADFVAGNLEANRAATIEVADKQDPALEI